MSKLDLSRFSTVKELQSYCQDQYNELLKLQAKSEEYQSKIQHLEELLRTGGSTITVGSTELEICRIEISRLYTQTMQEPLTDQEVRKFDTLVKCLLAIQGKAPEKKPKGKEQEYTPDELIAMALTAMPEKDEQ